MDEIVEPRRGGSGWGSGSDSSAASTSAHNLADPDGQIIEVLPKNSRQELRISLDRFRWHDLVSLRVWFDAGGGDARRRGKQGLAVRVGMLPVLRVALEKAEAETVRGGLLPEGHQHGS